MKVTHSMPEIIFSYCSDQGTWLSLRASANCSGSFSVAAMFLDFGALAGVGKTRDSHEAPLEYLHLSPEKMELPANAFVVPSYVSGNLRVPLGPMWK